MRKGTIDTMTMQEIEQDIFNDLKELGDDISQYTYLLQCASECRDYPEEYRTEVYLVRDCQMKTWLRVAWEKEHCVFDADSEALIVRGALALLQEIFDGRKIEEVKAYNCQLLEEKLFTKHFNRDQLKGLRAIVAHSCSDFS